ncbi:ABC transporter substrate-binding protein [Synechococcus sp. PCC 7336]|uniref:ABC transporter substrate-binding protein n=1 Tax=Synechococcus sp. PCC 7336 TaxID=195250 RepID=UPI00034DEEEC|nr:ABC transporter substrate-binding protein [Synechococcus sp. PCC 7336]
MSRLLGLLAGGLACAGLAACSGGSNLTPFEESDTENIDLVIWWNQGFLPEENAVITELLQAWESQKERETGEDITTELILLDHDNLLQNAVRAIELGDPPDMMFGWDAEESGLIPQLAWEGHLANVSDLVEPLDLSSAVKQAVTYHNNQTGESSYFSVPLGQQAIYIHYWKGLLEDANLSEADVPRQWDDFWQFWQDAQLTLSSAREGERGAQDEGVYGLGLSLSDSGTDLFWAFEQFLEAYGARLINSNRELQLDNPKVREGVTKAIAQFRDFYLNGFIPPEAVIWSDSGNNASFLNGQLLMTVNPTLSIPLTQKLPDSAYNAPSNERYYHNITTIPWPLSPDGTYIHSIITIKQAIVFENAQNPDRAQDFLAFLLQPDNLSRFVLEGNKGRVLPVLESLLDSPTWSNPDDPHLYAAARQMLGPIRPTYQVLNPAYGEVLAQNIWARAILSTIPRQILTRNNFSEEMMGTVPPEQTPESAAIWALDRVSQIISDWEIGG